MKKVVARKMGLTTKELNKKYFKKNKDRIRGEGLSNGW